tara:strand:+ start:4024 stop:5766 length:1743 start_codon:yes stop_codon:yes gene_type:complete
VEEEIEDNLDVKKDIVETELLVKQEIAVDVDSNIDELLKIIEQISKEENALKFSKKSEEIKALFYIKIKEKYPINSEKDDKKNEISAEEKEFKKHFNNYKKNKKTERGKLENKEIENLNSKKNIISEIKDLTKEVNLKKETFDKFKDLQIRWKKIGNVSIREKNNMWQLYNYHIENFYDCIKLNKDFRDLDFKKNLEVKNNIYKTAEKLLELKSIKKMHEGLQELHEKWKETGPVSRENRDEIWVRFQNISRDINKKRNDFFLEIKNKEKIKIDKKNTICLEIDTLFDEVKNHKNCQNAIIKFTSLKEKWYKLGKVIGSENKKCFEKLRESSNNFNKSKNDFYKNKKTESKKIIQKKLDICQQTQVLSKSTNWKESTIKIIRLQKSWEESGFSNSDKANKTWKEFKKHCDYFFKAKKLFYKKIEQDKEGNYKQKLEIVTNLQDLLKVKNDKETLNNIEIKWRKIGAIANEKNYINKDFNIIINKLFNKLELEPNELKIIQYKRKVNDIIKNPKALQLEKEKIRIEIDDKKKTIMQYENNKSFIVITKKENPLLKQIELSIYQIEKEVELLINNLKIINSI